MAKKKCECVSAQWLLEQLPELQKQNIVDDSSAQKLELFCRQKIADRTNNAGRNLLLVLGCCCALLTALGIALILSHNWDMFPDQIRLGLGNLPLIGGIILGFYTLLKDKSTAWAESTAILTGIGIGCSIASVAQVYNLGGSTKDFLQLWMLLSLPLIWVPGSISAVLLSSILFATWGGHAAHAGEMRFQYWSMLYLLVTAGYLFTVLGGKNSGIRNGFARWLLIPNLIFYPIYTGIAADDRGGWVMLTVLAGLLLFYGLRLRQTERPSAPLITGSFLGLLLAAAVTAYPRMTSAEAILVFTPEKWHRGNLPTAVIIGGLLIFLCERMVKLRQFYLLPPVALALVLLFTPEAWLCGAGSVLMFAGGGWMLYKSLHQRSLPLLNGGAAIIVVLAAEWFLSGDFPILWRGIGFIVIGLVFGGLNLLFYKKSKTISGDRA